MAFPSVSWRHSEPPGAVVLALGHVFLALYFAFLWVAWVLAVWIIKPKTVAPTASV
jgi:hypothetical protein